MTVKNSRFAISVILFSLLLTLPAWPTSAAGTTWYVDDDACPGPGSGTLGDPFCLIQDAIDAATADDIIEIAAGTYHEHLSMYTSLTVNGAGRTSTILDGNATGRVFYVHSGITVSIHSLTIQNGSADDGGVFSTTAASR